CLYANLYRRVSVDFATIQPAWGRAVIRVFWGCLLPVQCRRGHGPNQEIKMKPRYMHEKTLWRTIAFLLAILVAPALFADERTPPSHAGRSSTPAQHQAPAPHTAPAQHAPPAARTAPPSGAGHQPAAPAHPPQTGGAGPRPGGYNPANRSNQPGGAQAPNANPAAAGGNRTPGYHPGNPGNNPATPANRTPGYNPA